MKYFFILMISVPAFGAISPTVVKDSALKYHPTVIAALEKMRAGEEAVRGARGAFDTRIVSDYRRQTKHDWNSTVSRTFLEKPLRVANSKIYAGSEQISNANGKFSPVYNTGNPVSTGQVGNYSVLGLKLSLWKNFLLDPDRARFKNAKYEAKRVEAEKRLTDLDIGRLGQLAYWEWVTANKVKNVYEELLKNGETRNEYLMDRSAKGDTAKIVVTENEQYVANRKGSLQAAKERLLRAEYALSLFYRDENALPIIPSSTEAYEDYPIKLSALMENLDLNSNIDELMNKRPDLKNLALNVEKTDVDLELAKQDLKPQIDVTTEYYQRTQANITMPRDYLMVLAQINVPIERNLGNGNIAAARARKMVAQSEMTLGQQSYKFEVMALRQSLHLRLEQVAQSEIEFTKAKELVVSETYKFKSGGGNLYLVNLREEAQANAEASFHESRLAFMDTLLSYQALVSTAE
ncbi:TolC family protein [Peredibacter starrii]|uniref:TolC family protein n=1 Tax=Peredibacter starrii TaxID=28202 RepID=A0AAX4HMW0_9BACT|nr:TolC family protein [Peredibacter starrii]WPU64648.1 TolC family protein [Peredibacter starrii]